METIIILIISILPVYLLGIYIYKKDNNKEPKALLKKLFIYGMISCIPAGIIEITIGPIFGEEETMDLITLFFYVLISVGFVEEICKWFIVKKVAYNHSDFDELYDAIVYCVFVSLGFACLENVLYVFDSGIVVGLIRAVTAIPGHASDAIIMGNYLGLAKLADINGNKRLYKKNVMLSIIVPSLAHSIYDFCLFTESTFFVLVFFIFLIFIYVYSFKKIKRVSSERKRIYNDDNTNYLENNTSQLFKYCPNCGTKTYGNFCHNCGSNLSLNK